MERAFSLNTVQTRVMRETTLISSKKWTSRNEVHDFLYFRITKKPNFNLCMKARCFEWTRRLTASINLETHKFNHVDEIPSITPSEAGIRDPQEAVEMFWGWFPLVALMVPAARVPQHTQHQEGQDGI